MTNDICERLRSELGQMFTCSPHGDVVRIRTPFLYPDGDVIDLFFSSHRNGGNISDCGETVRWLRNQSVASKRSTGQRRLIDDVTQTTGTEFYRGMIQSRIADGPTGAAEAILRVSQAAIRIADIWFTFRSRSIQTVNDDISSFLTDFQVKFVQGESLIGRSGRSRCIDFHTWAEARSSLVIVLSTGSRSAAHVLADRTTAAWMDLSHLAAGQEPTQFVTLFDDTMDIWGGEDFKLVENVSRIARWSAPEEFLSIVTAAI